MKKIIHYIPRVLSIIIVGFLAVFILEAFDSNFGWQAGLTHLIVTLVALIITIIAWIKPKIGGWLFIIVGLIYLLSAIQQKMWSGLLWGAVPLITGILFLVDKHQNTQTDELD